MVGRYHRKRKILYAWSSNKKYAKPSEENITDHRARISMICNHIDMLPGNRRFLTSNEKKNLFYNSFPESWKKNINSMEGMLKTIILLILSTRCNNKRNKLISNTNQGIRITIKIRKIKTRKLPSRRSREAM